MRSRGLDAVVNQQLISGVLTFGALLGGLICGIICAAISNLYFHSPQWTTWGLVALMVIKHNV